MISKRYLKRRSLVDHHYHNQDYNRNNDLTFVGYFLLVSAASSFLLSNVRDLKLCFLFALTNPHMIIMVNVMIVMIMIIVIHNRDAIDDIGATNLLVG